MELAQYKLWHNCIGRKFLLEGGSVLNGAFAKADVIDELSLVQAPVLREKGDKPLFYDEVAGDYQLMKAEVLESFVWLRYYSAACREASGFLERRTKKAKIKNILQKMKQNKIITTDSPNQRLANWILVK